MAKYILGARDRVAGHLSARQGIAITLTAGGLVLFRAAMLVGVMAVAWHYGLL
jgi:hypothetical protein